MFTLEKRTASRKFVDLVKTAVSKLANWDPSIPIEAGDYGTINRETGQFERKGNIYNEIEINHIASRFPPIICPPVDTYQIASLTVKTLDTGYSVKSSPDGTSKVMFSGKWQFSHARGALLLMRQTQLFRLPDELLQELKASSWSKGKCIVTHAYKCPGYALYLSAKNNEIISISLHAGKPDTPSSDCAIGDGSSAYWMADGVVGTFQSAFASEPVFVPLYQVKELQKRRETRREGPELDEIEDKEWEAIDVPWDFIDENGQEHPDDLDDCSSECDSDKHE